MICFSLFVYFRIRYFTGFTIVSGTVVSSTPLALRVSSSHYALATPNCSYTNTFTSIYNYFPDSLIVSKTAHTVLYDDGTFETHEFKDEIWMVPLV